MVRSLVSRPCIDYFSKKILPCRIPQDSRKKPLFPPFPHEAQSFHRGGLRESCSESKAPSLFRPGEWIIDANLIAGVLISKVHEKANNSFMC